MLCREEKGIRGRDHLEMGAFKKTAKIANILLLFCLKQATVPAQRLWIWRAREPNEKPKALSQSLGRTSRFSILGGGILYNNLAMSVNFLPQYLWVGLQTSGNDPQQHRILELSCVLSDSPVLRVHEGPQLVLRCEEEHLLVMDKQNLSRHQASGLLQQCLTSSLSPQQAQQQVIDYLLSAGVGPRQLLLAGSSVHLAKLFLFQHMPRLDEYLHHRILDVTSVGLVVASMQSQFSYAQLMFKHQQMLRAQDSVRQSISELQHYMRFAFQ